MRGTVKAYSLDVNAGVIECDAGETYGFSQNDWNATHAPVMRERVTFQGFSRTATKVYAEK